MSHQDGATATEYIILVTLIALVIIGGATFLGNALNDEYSDVGTSVSNFN